MAADARGRRSFTTLVDRAASVLREEILSGDWAPGSRVAIDTVADRLEMSPIPVREALRSLASDGLLVALPQRGFRVADLTAADFEDLFRLRCVLDVTAVEMAVPRLQDGHVAALESAVEALAVAHDRGDWRAQRDHHRRFHFIVFEATGSAWLVRLLNILWDHSERYLQLSERYRGRPEHVAGEHRELLEAFRGGEVQRALVETRAHLDLTRKTVLDMLTGIDATPARTDSTVTRSLEERR